jgi:hypothetical protein
MNYIACHEMSADRLLVCAFSVSGRVTSLPDHEHQLERPPKNGCGHPQQFIAEWSNTHKPNREGGECHRCGAVWFYRQ